MDLPKKLKENEYMLKIRPAGTYDKYPTGFLAKYTQKGEMQKSFEDWGLPWYRGMPKVEPLPISLHIEEFRAGWEIISWRFGKSQNWAKLLHPCGFTVEVYLSDLLEVIRDGVISYGKLEGEYKWKQNKLIKKA